MRERTRIVEGRETEVHEVTRPGSPMLRIFQVLAAAAGAVLFVMGLMAAFRVDFGADLLDNTAGVGGFGFSAVAAIAAVVLGGAILAAALGSQDRGGAAFVGLLTLLVGIAALVAEGQIAEDVDVDRRSAALFMVIGVLVFVLSLIPWWSRRREVVEVVR